MLTASLERIERSLGCGDLVLDVGGWASPFPRADWVIDLMPYETRGLYGKAPVAAGERFSAETWVERDICDRETWPFADNQFEFAICSHTLEDVRDPVWVCAELSRVAKAGYVETPSRLEEQSWGVTGPFVGWSHHHWLVEATAAGGLEFALKPHALHASPEHFLTADQGAALTPEERVVACFWEAELDARERVFMEMSELHDYLAEPMTAHRERLESAASSRRPEQRRSARSWRGAWRRSR